MKKAIISSFNLFFNTRRIEPVVLIANSNNFIMSCDFYPKNQLTGSGKIQNVIYFSMLAIPAPYF
ncbi:hypothetical protein X975_10937, partial [Stegodyphus mimosarum]